MEPAANPLLTTHGTPAWENDVQEPPPLRPRSQQRMPESAGSYTSVGSTAYTDNYSSHTNYPSQNQHTLANYPEPYSGAQADLEKNGLVKKPSNEGVDPADYPDGGIEAWLVVLGAWCGQMASFGFLNSMGIFQEYYQFHQLSKEKPSTIAWISSMGLFIMFFGGLIAGKLFDNYGPRYILLFGSIVQVFGLMMTSLGTEYYQILLAQGVVTGLGGAFIFFACIACIPSWFYNKRGAAMGLTSTGGAMGGVIFPIMLRKIIPTVGFGWSMRILAFTTLGLLVIANVLVKIRISPVPKPLKPGDLFRPMKELPFALLVLGSVFFNLGCYIPYNYIMLHAMKYKMDTDLATYLIPIMNGASVFGRIIPGILADKVGKFNMMIMTCAGSVILVLAIWLPSRGNAAILVFAGCYGFTSGSFVSLGPALIAQLSDVRELGVRSGILFLLVSFSALIGNPIAGALLGEGRDNYNALMYFCSIVMFISTCLYIGSRWAQVGWKWVAA